MDPKISACEALTTWAKEHGANLHQSVEIRRDAGTGASFIVKTAPGPEQANVAAGDEVVSCPASITLSYLNTLPDMPAWLRRDQTPFTTRFLAETPPHVISRFLLMKEYLAGSSSFWHSYIQALPQPGDFENWCLPPFWEADDQELLEGTNVDVSLQEIKSRLKDEFRTARKMLESEPAGNWGKAEDFTRLLYHWAYAVFTSRSFMPELVLPGREAILLPEAVKWDDFSVLLPLLDIGNHSVTAKVKWEVDEQELRCRLVTKSGYGPGQQVYNNYGMKTNSQLLLGYGFMISEAEDLHNEYIHVRKRLDRPLAEGEKPQEYLLSLRAMADSSSVVGRSLQPISREILSSTSLAAIFPPFTHIQESMVSDLVVAQAAAARLAAAASAADSSIPSGTEVLRQFLTGNIESALLRPLLQQTIAIVQHKAFQELERLEETEFDVGEEEEAGLTRNQRLAMTYRRQCRKVLENVLASIEIGQSDGEEIELDDG